MCVYVYVCMIDERVGQLCCVLASSEVADTVKSQLKILSRRLWSNPPNHGARIVATALCNPTLFQEWYTYVLYYYHITLDYVGLIT